MKRPRTKPWSVGVACALAFLAMASSQSKAQSIAAPFAGSYSLDELGSVPGVPGPYGGLTLLAGDQNTLLLGGNANNGSGAIYSIGVVRDAGGHITGFSGTASLFATAPNIDGGLAYGPGGVLFATGFPNNTLLQFKPGSTTPDKTISLTSLGITASVGTLAFIPSYAPGAGGFRIASYSGGGFYSVDLTPDGSGTYNLSNAQLEATPGGGPEGIIYVTPGSPVFSGPSMLLSEYGAGRVSAYSVDANGNPIVASRQDFITGLGGAEGAFLDPYSGDFLFSTFGGSNRVIAVRGFMAVPEPASMTLLGLGLAGIAAWRFRRRRQG